MLETLVTVIILCTNQNWEHSERCTAPIAYFELNNGVFTGELTSGVKFRQENGVFEMEQVKWRVVGNQIEYIYETADTEAKGR